LILQDFKDKAPDEILALETNSQAIKNVQSSFSAFEKGKQEIT
jgi:hypothetical protein